MLHAAVANARGINSPLMGCDDVRRGGRSRSFFFRDMAGGAGSHGSRMPYDPGDAMGVLIHVACVMLGPTPTRQFQSNKSFFDRNIVHGHVFKARTANRKSQGMNLGGP